MNFSFVFDRPIEWNSHFAQSLRRARASQHARALLRDLAERLFLRVSASDDVSHLEYKKEILEVSETPEFTDLQALMEMVLGIVREEPVDENQTELADRIQEATEFVDRVLLKAQVISEIGELSERIAALKRVREESREFPSRQTEKIADAHHRAQEFRQAADRASNDRQALEALSQSIQEFKRELAQERTKNLRSLIMDLPPHLRIFMIFRVSLINWINAHRRLFLWIVPADRR
jgi:hypothetical protein